MRLTRLSNISLAKAISLAAFTALAVAVAIGFLADFPTNATAFNAGGSDGVARHVPIPAQYTAQCSNGIAVPNPVSNPGLVADCAALLASKDTLEGTTGNLNWSVDVVISDWNGITVGNNQVAKLEWSNYAPPLSGEIPSELGNLANLTHLNLGRNQLTGEIPVELGNLANLMHLELMVNQLTGTTPSELGNLDNIRVLHLADNQLTGEVPTELGNLANLSELWLNSNQLTGAIPTELGNLNNLNGLSLGGNQLISAIPAELGNLNNLNHLDLSNNRLTGTIPLELSHLSNLQGLFLNNNQLTGVIPVELGNLSNLDHLDLSNNQLTGVIPPELGNFSRYWELRLNGNRLTGCIPESLRSPLGDVEIELLGLPICAATAADRIAALETQSAEQASVIAALQAQLAEHASRLAALEGASAPAPTATPTATPSPTPTSVAGASGGACVQQMADNGRVSSVWDNACLSANAPDDGNAYYARFYTFTLDTSADVTITLSAAKPPYIYLLEGVGMDGNLLQDAGNASRTSQTINASLQAGSYTIEASTWNPNVTGDFTLTLDMGR